MALKTGKNAIDRLLTDERVRTIQLDDQTFYRATDLVAILTDEPDARAEWDELKLDEPTLRARCIQAEVGGEPQDMLNLSGVMQLIGIIDAPKAARLRSWISNVAARHVEEQADPELAIQRLRQSYVAQGAPASGSISGFARSAPAGNRWRMESPWN